MGVVFSLFGRSRGWGMLQGYGGEPVLFVFAWLYVRGEGGTDSGSCGEFIDPVAYFVFLQIFVAVGGYL